jgi:hypothetical protein
VLRRSGFSRAGQCSSSGLAPRCRHRRGARRDRKRRIYARIRAQCRLHDRISVVELDQQQLLLER